MIQGKGFYIWQIRRTEAGNAAAIAQLAAQAGLKHVLIKIADGTKAYNLDPITGADLVPAVIRALRDRSISVLGWHYVYGYEPEAEADIALQRIQMLGVDAYVIDAEDQYQLPGRDEAATIFMGRLRRSLPSFPMALSSYRYPTYHPAFPWPQFLEQVNINMPQVYWVEAQNPADQLVRCQREFNAIQPVRPIIPTGSAYLQGDWRPTPEEIVAFMDTARSLNMQAVNFWEWAHTRLYLPELWQAISDYQWPLEIPQGDILDRYFAALNAHDPAVLSQLYISNAVHVTPDRTVQGRENIQAWYKDLFQRLPEAVFTIGEQSGEVGSRHFSWTAESPKGTIRNGQDSFGLVNGLIAYHYTYFKIE